MSNQPWECPRCGKMNAPFNHACFCSREEIVTPINGDSERYFNSIPNNARCLICNGFHGVGVGCMMLKVTD